MLQKQQLLLLLVFLVPALLSVFQHPQESLQSQEALQMQQTLD
jgi:hypothetical protein